jgi:membrane protein implicated in regulation of membrane protease activity
MAEQNADSLRELVQGLLEDTRDLVRAELALAKAEIREEISAAGTVGAAFSAAALTGVLGITLLAVALGGALAYALGWPSWAGFGIVAFVLLASAWLLARFGTARLKKLRTLPKTKQTMKENFAWIQNKSVER